MGLYFDCDTIRAISAARIVRSTATMSARGVMTSVASFSPNSTTPLMMALSDASPTPSSSPSRSNSSSESWSPDAAASRRDQRKQRVEQAELLQPLAPAHAPEAVVILRDRLPDHLAFGFGEPPGGVCDHVDGGFVQRKSDLAGCHTITIPPPYRRRLRTLRYNDPSPCKYSRPANIN